MVYSEKILDHAKKSATDTLNTSSKRVIQNTAEATGDFIGNKIANKITWFSKNSETVTNKHDKKIPKERYIHPEERQKIIDNLGMNIIA